MAREKIQLPKWKFFCPDLSAIFSIEASTRAEAESMLRDIVKPEIYSQFRPFSVENSLEGQR